MSILTGPSPPLRWERILWKLILILILLLWIILILG